MATTIIEKDGKPVQIYNETGACKACVPESGGWVNPMALGYSDAPAMYWGTLAAGLFLGYLLFRGT